MRVLVCLSLLFLFGHSYAQDTGIPAPSSDLLGTPSSVTFDRVYVRIGGRNVGSRSERLSVEQFDKEGRTTEFVEYGSGFLRTRYRYDGNVRIAEVTYLDATGNPEPSGADSFKSKVDTVVEAGLCPRYTVRTDDDEGAKVNRIHEVCTDGSERAKTTEELDSNGNLVRSVRSDALGRKWQKVCEYDSRGNLTEYRYTVILDSKSYTHTIRYSDYRFDEKGNWTRVTATAFVSTKPDELRYQFNEHRTIAYYSDTSTTTK